RDHLTISQPCQSFKLTLDCLFAFLAVARNANKTTGQPTSLHAIDPCLDSADFSASSRTEVIAMLGHWIKIRYGLLAATLGLGAVALWPQTPPSLPEQPAPLVATAEPPKNEGDQQGVSVQTRGPIHEAFASLATEPAPTQLLPKKPPQTI